MTWLYLFGCVYPGMATTIDFGFKLFAGPQANKTEPKLHLGLGTQKQYDSSKIPASPPN
jgi:hypothetical protein